MDFRIVYITCQNKDEAQQIGQKMVEAKLAACANILPQMESIYEWKGSIQVEAEVVLLLKSSAAHIPAIEKQ